MDFNIGWPEGIWIAIVLINFVTVAVLHGQTKKESKHNFALTFVGVLLSFLLLIWGGFFS